MIQIRFVFRDSSGRLYSDKPAKIILPLPLPHQLENGTDMRTIQDAITYLQQREIPKRLWNIENNQVKAVHTVCRHDLETTQQGPMFAIYDNDVISYSMVPDEDYIIVTSKEEDAVVARNNNDGDVSTEAMQETQMQSAKNTTTRESLAVEKDSGDMTSVAVANVNDSIAPKNQVNPIQTLDNQATNLASTTAEQDSPNKDFDNNTSVEQVPISTTQKRKESTLESDVTANAKKMKVAMQTDQIQESTIGNANNNVDTDREHVSNSITSKCNKSVPEKDTAIDSTSVEQSEPSKESASTDSPTKSDETPNSPSVGQGSLSTNSTRKESMPECNIATEVNRSRVGTQTETLDEQTNKDSDSLFQSTWEEQFQLLRKFYDKNGHSHITKAHRTLGVFASQLKMKSVRDKLTDKQKEDLASVKFDMFNKTRYTRQEQMDKRWMERFEQLKEYKKNHDHMNVRRGEDKTLYQWVSAQRYFKKSSQLPKGRAKLLEEIGFKWESSQVGKRLLSQTSTSVEQVPLLIAPKPKDIMPVGKGSLSQASTSVKQVPILIAPKRKDPIPESGTATESTKSIVGTQTETLDGITDAKNNINNVRDKLTGTQKEDLANVKFDMLDKMTNSQFLVPKRSKNDERWMKRLHKLKEYKNKHGHMMVRGFEDKDLNTWISNQRHYKRSSKLREDRVKLLEEIGFRWESEYHQRTHEGRLNTINTSKDQVLPPKSDIATESIKLKVGTPNENLNGQTNAKSESNCDSLLQSTWKERFRQLKQFHRKNGHSQIAKSHPVLGTWATQLTLNSVRDRLTDKQKADLASVSFYLFNRMKNPRVEKLDMRWMERFDKLKEYKSKNGHMKVRRSEDNDLYSWIAAQKGFKRSNKLRKDRDKLLEEIGFQWNSYAEQTETSKRKESTPESNTVTNSTSVEPVPLFISAPKRKDPFAESSIVPDSKQFTRRTNLDERWMERFNKLKEYKRKHGHMMVRGTEDKDLYTWIRNQRNFKRHSQFRNDRMELLEEIGFSWESNTSIAHKRKESTPTSDTATDSTGIEQIWTSKDPTRKESTQECDTEREPKKLKMVKQTDQNQQRLNEGYIKSISDEQSLLSTASKHKESTSESDTAIISKMLQVETQVSFSDSWMKNYHKLKEYKNKHGHTTVLMRENKDLYEWTVYQRDSKRNNELCENRVTLLEEIGFKWSKRRQGFSDERWMNKYDKLQEYKKKYRHVMVQRSQDKELYTWTVTQRFTKRRNELCEDRAKLLEDVGFVWEIDKSVANESAEQKVTDHEKEKVGVRMERWMKNYHKLKDFKQKHGHLILHESHDKGLYRWVLNQRAFKRKGIMYEDRVKLLEDIGFLWDGRLTSKNDANSLSATKDISVPKESPQKPKSRSPSSLNELQKSSSKKRKRATDNDDTKSHTRTFQQPVPEKLAKSLALSTDCENLNKLHQFVRSDLLEIIQENHKIGLQCIFCKASPEPQSRSKIFPQYLENKGLGLYRKVCEWQRVHFKQCTHIPDAVKEKYDELKLADKSRGKVQYWEDSAKQIGLFNKEGGGICFLGDSKDGNAESELSKE